MVNHPNCGHWLCDKLDKDFGIFAAESNANQ